MSVVDLLAEDAREAGGSWRDSDRKCPPPTTCIPEGAVGRGGLRRRIRRPRRGLVRSVRLRRPTGVRDPSPGRRASGGIMKIERIDLYWVKLPLIYPWRTAYGEDWDIHSALVRLEAEEGLYGWGRRRPSTRPHTRPSTPPGLLHAPRPLRSPHPRQEISSESDLLDRLAVFKGNQFAKAGLEWLGGCSTPSDRAYRFIGRWAGSVTGCRSGPTTASRTPWTCSWQKIQGPSIRDTPA